MVFEGVPAYSSVLLRQRIHLRTVIVTAGVHPRFGRKLLPHLSGDKRLSAYLFVAIDIFTTQNIFYSKRLDYIQSPKR